MIQRTKYEEIIHYVYDLIEGKKVRPGDNLPSITDLSRTLCAARETVVKSYKILKQEGVIDSIPGKGFFLLTDRISSNARVLLILNSFNPYMQVLYNAFARALPAGVVGDVYFHQNSMIHFKTLIESYSSRYTHFIIKPFYDERIPELLSSLDSRRTLILDRGEYLPPGCSCLCQNFSNGISDVLEQIPDRIRKYSSLNMIRTPLNPHPEESFLCFENFLNNQSLKGEVLESFREESIRKGAAYIILTEQDLVSLLSLCDHKGWVPGSDIGIISYNDFPLLEFVSGGITSLSVDFKKMGELAAHFPLLQENIQKIMKPQLFLRRSL